MWWGVIKREQCINKPQQRRGWWCTGWPQLDLQHPLPATPQWRHADLAVLRGATFLQPFLISYLSNWFSWRCVSPPPPSKRVRAPQRSNVHHKVKHRQSREEIFNETSMLISRSIYVLFTPSHPSFLLSGLSPPSLNRERSSNHQSALSHCGRRQCHAGLSVLPDRTAVPSGYPYTSSLTPMIFTRCTENWKIHKSLKWPHSSQTLDFGDQCVFYQGFSEWKLLFLSMSNHCPLQPALFRGSQQENVVLMLFWRSVIC